MSATAYKDLGIVRAVGLYPVKSMQGQSVDGVKLGFAGLAHDREYTFLREEDTTGPPWLSARRCPRLFGAMFAPRPFDVAKEMVRVAGES